MRLSGKATEKLQREQVKYKTVLTIFISFAVLCVIILACIKARSIFFVPVLASVMGMLPIIVQWQAVKTELKSRTVNTSK